MVASRAGDSLCGAAFLRLGGAKSVSLEPRALRGRNLRFACRPAGGSTEDRSREALNQFFSHRPAIMSRSYGLDSVVSRSLALRLGKRPLGPLFAPLDFSARAWSDLFLGFF